MTTVIDYNQVIQEMVVFLRNQDIYTVTERGVTTANATGTFATTSSLLINKTNVRNIRSIVVGGVTKTFGTDYTVDYTYLDTTIKCKISFVAAQTGAYVISHDYGTDIIFSDWPREDLSIGSFPRCSVQLIGDDSVDASLPGDIEESNLSFGISVFDVSVKEVDTTHTAIKEDIIANKKDFYYLRYVQRLNYGPLLPFPAGKNKVLFKTMNYLSRFNLETE